MQPGSLCNEDVLHDGYQPKMLLYALDEPLYVFDQVKQQQGMDEKIIVAYKILCLSALRCTEWQHGSEKKGMPDALSLLNVNDAHHLECLGQYMMGHCWWVSGLSIQETTHGVRCWLACTGTSTEAVRTRPIARHTHWPPGEG